MDLTEFPPNNSSDLVPTPRFTGIFIPVEILEMEEINAFDKILLSWIDALYCKKHKGCFASNEYLAQRLKVEANTIAKNLSKLRKLNLIEDVSFDGRIRVIRTRIHLIIHESQGKADLDNNPIAIGQPSNPAIAVCPSGVPPQLYTESKEENPPLSPPLPNSKGKSKKNEEEDFFLKKEEIKRVILKNNISQKDFDKAWERLLKRKSSEPLFDPVIWLLKVIKNFEKEKVQDDKIERRKKYAKEKLNWSGGACSWASDEKGVHFYSGNVERIYAYTDEEFWKEKGL